LSIDQLGTDAFGKPLAASLGSPVGGVPFVFPGGEAEARQAAERHKRKGRRKAFFIFFLLPRTNDTDDVFY